MSITYIEGDLFDHIPAKLAENEKDVFICHVCNDKGGWGSGFVVPLGQRYPAAKEAYKKAFSLTQCDVQFVEVETIEDKKIHVCNMVAQTLGGVRPLNYSSLVSCMNVVGDRLQSINGHIHAPMFGAGLAGGNWNFITNLIQDCWLSRGIPVTIHYLPQYLPNNWNPPGVKRIQNRIELNLTEKEIAVLEELGKKQELSKEKILIQGLRLYQLKVEGEPPHLPKKLSPEATKEALGRLQNGED